jgi:LysR family hydrogen peroxide-inducible transcriptional activator
VIPTIAPFLLPRALPLLRERFPKLKLFLREDLTHRLIEGLKSGALDAALIALPYDTTGLETAPVSEDELLAMAPANHPLTACDKIRPDDLQDNGLILLEDGHCLREQALSVCGLHAPRGGEEGGFAATSLHTLVQMVGSGLGVSLLPAMAVEAGLADDVPVVIRPIAVGKPSRRIVVAWRAGSSRGVEGKLLAETLKPAA